MLRKSWTAGSVGVILLVLAGCDNGAKAPSNQGSETASAPPVEALAPSNSKTITQVPPAPASPQVVEPSPKPVADANPTSVGIAVWIRNSAVGINLSTGQVMIVPSQHN